MVYRTFYLRKAHLFTEESAHLAVAWKEGEDRAEAVLSSHLHTRNERQVGDPEIRWQR